MVGASFIAPIASFGQRSPCILLHDASVHISQRQVQLAARPRPMLEFRSRTQHRQQRCRCRSANQDEAEKESGTEEPDVSVSSIDLNKEVTKFARNTASTFAPRASGPSKNPAYPGSTLYKVFEVQSYISIVVGALLSFNVIFPSDQPDIARLIGMWSIWMFAIPSLRARDCAKVEKDALNILFLAVPLINVLLPFVWKSFPFIFSADVVALLGVYTWKVWLPSGEQQQS